MDADTGMGTANEIGPDGARAIGDGMRECLEHIDLACECGSGQGRRKEMLTQRGMQPTRSATWVPQRLATAWPSTAASSTSILQVCISAGTCGAGGVDTARDADNGLCDEGASAISKGMGKCHSLQHVDLGGE